MPSAEWDRVKELLHRALQLALPERARFLDEACGTDLSLRSEVESMLAAEAAMGARFLQSSPLSMSGIETGSTAGELAPGELFAKRFVLMNKLGEGGMGQVWLAEQTEPVRRLVALKLIRAGMYDASVVQRFLSERQSLAIMDHPAIARVFDAGATPLGQPYFVMEYVPGLPITEYCDRHRLPLNERLSLLIQACAGVQHAHQKAVIHRDLKPANILIVEVDGRAMPRIIDFGLAKAVVADAAEHTQYTRFGQLMGTPGYMSPEQLDPNMPDVDTRTDVYSLGVILYVLLTGSQPFARRRTQRVPLDEMLRRLREEEPVLPSAQVASELSNAEEVASARRTEPKHLAHEIKGDLDWIAMKALARDRARRYGTPTELAADLQRYLNHEPILARPVGKLYQFAKYARRHRVAAAGVAGIVCALGVGLIVALWQAQVAREAAREAHEQEQRATHLSAQSAEQAGDAAYQDGRVTSALADVAEAVRLDPEDPALRAELLSLLEEQGLWWLPLGALQRRGILDARFSVDAQHVLLVFADGSAQVWDSRLSAPVGHLMQHAGPINAVGFSANGAYILTASNDHTARVWDAASGEPLGPALTHAAAVNDGSFSADGNLIVTACDDGVARLWDWRTGRMQATPMHSTAAMVLAQFSPNNARIVTVSGNAAQLWDGSGRPVKAALKHSALIRDAKFSFDGRYLVTASDDATARIWDASTGQSVSKPMPCDYGVESAEFSPDGTQIATVCPRDRAVRIFDVASGKPIGEPLRQLHPPHALELSQDGRRAFTASIDGTVRAWELAPRRDIGEPVRLSMEFRSEQFSPDGALLLTTSIEGAQVWQRRASGSVAGVLADNTATFVRFDSKGARIIANSATHAVQVWDVRTGRLLIPALSHTDEVLDAAFSPDGTQIVSASEDHTAHLWNAATGEPVGAPMRHDSAVNSAQFIPDGTGVLTATRNGMLRLWDAHSGQAKGAPINVGSAEYGFALSSDGRRVATHAQGLVKIFDVQTGARLGDAISLGEPILVLAFSPDGDRIVTSAQGITRLFDARSGAPLGAPMVHDMGTHRGSLQVQFSPDGTRLATAFEDAVNNSARLWDAHTGAPVGQEMRHGASILRVRFSPDGNRLVTASSDETAQLWDAHTGTPFGPPLRHESDVWYAEFSPDGKSVVTASSDGTSRLWDAQTGRPVSGSMHHETPLRSAIFSPDGRAVLTRTYNGRRFRLWPVLNPRREDVLMLADIAEEVGGFRLDPLKGIVPVTDRLTKLRTLLQRGNGAHPANGDVDRFVQELNESVQN